MAVTGLHKGLQRVEQAAFGPGRERSWFARVTFLIGAGIGSLLIAGYLYAVSPPTPVVLNPVPVVTAHYHPGARVVDVEVAPAVLPSGCDPALVQHYLSAAGSGLMGPQWGRYGFGNARLQLPGEIEPGTYVVIVDLSLACPGRGIRPGVLQSRHVFIGPPPVDGPP